MSKIHEALKRAEQERNNPGVSPGPEGQHPGGESQAASANSAAVAPEEFAARCAKKDWDPNQRTMLFFGDEERVGMEEFRVLRSRLYQMQERTGLKTLLVTSALPREGKSFMAANLAQVLVHRNGRKVLLIDGDLRAPRLHVDLGASGEPGLSELLSGEKDEFDVTQRGPLEGLFVIPAGRRRKNPAELVSNGQLKGLFTRLGGFFDWIVVDSPPLLVSDTVIMAAYCDGVIMVIRSGMTPFDVVRKARRELDERPLVGTILNGVDPDQSPYTHYYYSYYSSARKHGHQEPSKVAS